MPASSLEDTPPLPNALGPDANPALSFFAPREQMGALLFFPAFPLSFAAIAASSFAGCSPGFEFDIAIRPALR
jgi:hypothetical protein